MDEGIVFTVPGQPVGKGRPKTAVRGGKFAHMYTPEKTVNYEGLVSMAGKEAMCGQIPMTGPLLVTLEIVLQVPASWSKKKQAAALEGIVLPTKKPDLDNVIKAIFDGLNGVCYMDDVQIVESHQRKIYGVKVGVKVGIKPIFGGQSA